MIVRREEVSRIEEWRPTLVNRSRSGRAVMASIAITAIIVADWRRRTPWCWRFALHCRLCNLPRSAYLTPEHRKRRLHHRVCRAKPRAARSDHGHEIATIACRIPIGGGEMSGHVHLVLCRGGGSGDRGAVAHRVATVLWLDGLVVEEHRDRFYLGRLSTVFQAEVNAIREAADYLLPTGDQRLMVTFYVDSQAAILALDSNLVKSRVVWDCIESLNALGRKTQISIRWVKAHVGIWGNEAADDMAQMGALNTGLAHGPEPFLPVSQAVLKSFLNTALLDYWTATWQARPDCRQTKIWFPKVDLLKSAKVVSRNRDEISGLVQILTGHNFMNRHNHVIDQDEPAECRLCLEDEESSWHVVAECPALALPRLQVFESHALESPPDWSVTQLSRFLRVPAMRSLLDWVGVE